MSYRIDIHNDIAEEIKDVINEQNDKGIRSLNDSEVSIDERIHDTRKRLKKIRAALRLIRYCIPKKTYRKMNSLYRDLGHELGPLRDSKVKLKNLRKFLNETGEAGNPGTEFRDLEAKFVKEYTHSKTTFEQNEVAERVKESLIQQSDKILELPLKNKSPKKFVKGLRKIYRQGKKAKKIALSDPSPEKMHEWRKCVKYLWYHTRLLRDIWKPVMKGYRNSLDEVSDYLGDKHDLDVLLHELHHVIDLNNPAFSGLMDVVQKKKAALTEKAFRQGSKHYIEKPKTLFHRLLKYWEMERMGA